MNLEILVKEVRKSRELGMSIEEARVSNLELYKSLIDDYGDELYKAFRSALEEPTMIEIEARKKAQLDKVESIVKRGGKSLTKDLNKFVRRNKVVTIVEVNGVLRKYGYEPTFWNEHLRFRNGKFENVKEHYKLIKRVLS